MSVWDTFSASFHLVQEKLEQVLEDPSAEEDEQVRVGDPGRGRGLRSGEFGAVKVCPNY